jgi:hypothetical protein
MAWHETFPDPTAYYHVPKKTLHPTGDLENRLDAGAPALALWTPHRRHETGDPYRPDQRGHLARVTLNLPTKDGYQCEYDVHQTKKGITATVTQANHERGMTISELESIATRVRYELHDYQQPTTTIGRFFETLTHYRARTQQRMVTDLNNMVDAYYMQEAGKTITIQ